MKDKLKIGIPFLMAGVILTLCIYNTFAVYTLRKNIEDMEMRVNNDEIVLKQIVDFLNNSISQKK